jgi:hypothetical protein
MVTLLGVVPVTARLDGLLGAVGIVGTVVVVGGFVVGVDPRGAVCTGGGVAWPRTD